VSQFALRTLPGTGACGMKGLLPISPAAAHQLLISIDEIWPVLMVF
jgi:hypothetical protein